MASIDFLIQEERSLETVKLVVSECLGVSDAVVAVIQNAADYPVAGTYYAVCKVHILPRGMKQLITVDWPAVATTDGLIECLASHFGVECLVPSKDTDPYRMELVSPDGFRKQVSVDVRLLDDYGVFQIVA
jgi:hypothetical protein